MAIYPPPVNILSVFDLNDYNNTQNNTVSSTSTETPITPAYLEANYCKFPTCQGLLQTVPTANVLSNVVVDLASTLYTNTIRGNAPTDNCNLILNKTTSANDFNFGDASTSGQTITFGNSTNTNQVSNVELIENAINPLLDTAAFNLGNFQVNGILNIGTNNARTGDIDIGEPRVSSLVSKNVNIGISTAPLVVGVNSATANTTIKYFDKSVNSYSITIGNDYTVPIDFPIDGFINSNTVNGRLYIAQGAGTSYFSFRSFSVYSTDVNFSVVLPAGYSWGGLATSWGLTDYYLYSRNVHSFIVDDVNLIVILASANNCLNRPLTIPAVSSFINPTRGTITNTFTAGPTTRSATGAVGVAAGPTSFTLPQKGLYFLRLYIDCASSNATSTMIRVGLGVNTTFNDNFYTTQIRNLTSYTDTLSFTFKNSTTKYSQILTGCYVNNESSSSIIYPINIANFTNAAGGIITVNSKMDCWLIG